MNIYTEDGKAFRIETEAQLIRWVELKNASPEAMQAFLKTLPVVARRQRAA